jgi:hypothetical protein
MADLEAERRALGKDIARWKEDLRSLSRELGEAVGPASVLDRLTQTQQRIAQVERRLLAVGEQTQTVREGLLHEDDARDALARFGPVWEALSPPEQARLVRLAVEGAVYDGRKGTL